MTGTITKRSKGVYLIRLDLGRDEEGKRRRHAETFRGTRDQADVYLRNLLKTFDAGRWTEPSSRPLHDWLREWLEVVVKPNVSVITWQDYSYIVRSYINPGLGHIPLKRLDPMAIQAAWTKLLTGEDRARPLAPKTVLKAHTVLHNALQEAVLKRLLAYPPTADVKRKKVRRKATVRALRTRALSKTQIDTFLRVAVLDKWAPLWLCSIFSGARPEEVLGLRWPRVHWDQSAIAIEEVLIRVRKVVNGKKQVLEGPCWRLEVPKTEHSQRTIPLPLPVMRALKKHQAGQDEEKAFFEKAYNDHGFVFASQKGEPLHHRNLLRRFKELIEEAGLPANTRWYDLRHSHASLLVADGHEAKTVSMRLGHRSVAFTLDTYVDEVDDQQQRATDRLSEMFSDSLGPSEPVLKIVQPRQRGA